MHEGIAISTKNAADKVALRGVRVRAQLSGMSQKTTVEQTFINVESKAIEAVYTFPLPENAAVCAFEVITADRVLTGKIEEREQAIGMYDNAIRQGDGGFLVERERPDIFTVRVGNLKPAQAATISLTYVSELEVVDRSIRVVFPTTVAPRYVTATASDPMEMMIDGDAINPPHVLSVPYGLTMEVDIDLARPLKSIASPSHTIKTEFAENQRYRATFAGGIAEMNRDVVLNLELAGEQKPHAQVAVGPDGAKYVAVSFLPEFAPEENGSHLAVDVMFVLDCSGSMAGQSIEQAKTALELCLRSMNAGDRFNICRFGSNFQFMSAEPLTYSDVTLTQAVDYMRCIKADLGGTEIHAPLTAILESSAPLGGMRQIILLTDGHVSNEVGILQLATLHRAHNRVFSFGIGSAPSRNLVTGLARVSRGVAEFIAEGENIADKVLRTFSRMASPVITDVEVDWGGCEVAPAPAEVPPIFDGDAAKVLVRIEGALPTQVALKATTTSGKHRWVLKLPESHDNTAVIATAWARRMIENMEDSSDKTTAQRDKLVRISRTFNLLCSLTAFVAIEHRSVEERNEGQPALRRIPSLLAKCWGNVAPPCLSVMACEMPAFTRSSKAPRRMRTVDESAEYSFSLECRDTSPEVANRIILKEVCSMLPLRRDHQNALHNILRLQSSDGWFGWDEKVAKILDEVIETQPCSEAWQVSLRAFAVDPSTINLDHLRHTTLVIFLLSHRFGDEEFSWRRAIAKAIRYLAQASGKTTQEVAAWLNTVIDSLAAKCGKMPSP